MFAEASSNYTIQLLVAIVGGLVVLFLWQIWGIFRDRLKVGLVVKRTQKELPGMLELYSRLFPDDGTNYSAEEILSFFADENGHRQATHVEVEDLFLVATVRDAVAGFLFCHYYPEINYALVTYFGIDKAVQRARERGAEILLKRLMKILRNRQNPCDLLIFELQKPNNNLDRTQNQERRARVGLFKQRAAMFGFHAYRLLFDYQRPKLSLDPKLTEENLVLMCVPLNPHKPTNVLPKAGVIKLLEFIHHYCYADFYSPSDPLFTIFQNYLEQRLNLYRQTLPDQVPVD